MADDGAVDHGGPGNSTLVLLIGVERADLVRGPHSAPFAVGRACGGLVHREPRDEQLVVRGIQRIDRHDVERHELHGPSEAKAAAKGFRRSLRFSPWPMSCLPPPAVPCCTASQPARSTAGRPAWLPRSFATAR